ncbi:hypothetical protein V8F20_002352 [Naviculisporaceae sp. PSN 640]
MKQPSALLTTLHKQGYIIIPSFLNPSELDSLRTATANLTSLARAGSWPHIRTVGKQFPPWPSTAPPPEEGGIWGVQHLLHPDLPISASDRAAFIRLYFSEKILAVVHELLQTSPATKEPGGGEHDDGNGVLVMELLNLLVRPDKPFSLRWHRDDIPPTASPEDELSRLTAASIPIPPTSNSLSLPKYNHTQWNLPLYSDSSLFLIPHSHARTRTEIERSADPYADSLPNMLQVNLQAGDIAFYDNDILHRGVYEADKERMTLHGSVSCVSVNVGGSGSNAGASNGGSESNAGAGTSNKRARNVLQHGVGEWVDRCDFGGVLREARLEIAEGMRRRLVEMGRENSGGKDLGFSLSG